MSTTPAPLTPAEIAALDLALRREAIDAQKAQTAAIEANTREQVASREAAMKMADAMAARPGGVSEAFVLNVLTLVLQGQKTPAA